MLYELMEGEINMGNKFDEQVEKLLQQLAIQIRDDFSDDGLTDEEITKEVNELLEFQKPQLIIDIQKRYILYDIEKYITRHYDKEIATPCVGYIKLDCVGLEALEKFVKLLKSFISEGKSISSEQLKEHFRKWAYDHAVVSASEYRKALAALEESKDENKLLDKPTDKPPTLFNNDHKRNAIELETIDSEPPQKKHHGNGKNT